MLFTFSVSVVVLFVDKFSSWTQQTSTETVGLLTYALETSFAIACSSGVSHSPWFWFYPNRFIQARRIKMTYVRSVLLFRLPYNQTIHEGLFKLKYICRSSSSDKSIVSPLVCSPTKPPARLWASYIRPLFPCSRIRACRWLLILVHGLQSIRSLICASVTEIQLSLSNSPVDLATSVTVVTWLTGSKRNDFAFLASAAGFLQKPLGKWKSNHTDRLNFHASGSAISLTAFAA